MEISIFVYFMSKNLFERWIGEARVMEGIFVWDQLKFDSRPSRLQAPPKIKNKNTIEQNNLIIFYLHISWDLLHWIKPSPRALTKISKMKKTTTKNISISIKNMTQKTRFFMQIYILCSIVYFYFYFQPIWINQHVIVSS